LSREAEPPEVSKPARDKSEEAKEEAVNGPIETFTETVLEDTPATENPAAEKSEETKEKATNEPMETFTKPVVVDTPATEDPAPHVATEASPALDPGGGNTALEDIETATEVNPKQNRKQTKKAPIKVRDKPKDVEHCANAAQASMTGSKASKMAIPSTNPPEVAR
jgi:hypothetical protein